MDDQIKNRLAAVKLVILDVDGVMTDGKLYFTAQGQNMKAFNTKDGHGIRLLLHYGIDVAVISGRESAAARCRLEDLGVKEIHLGHPDKKEVFAKLMSDRGCHTDHVAYMGDDLPDLSIMVQVGLACAVADAHAEVKHRAHWVSDCDGGHGAVRELCELLLKEQGHWPEVLRHCSPQS